jgi:hypothetical protein
MEPERAAAGVAADLQDLPGGNGNRGPAAVIERVLIRDDRVQRVVAAAQVEHDEAARAGSLSLRDVGEERGRGETDRERRNAATNEVPTCNCHDADLQGAP